MQGWIKLHRKFMTHWLYDTNEPYTKREAWIDILLQVNHSEQKVNLGDQIIVCKTGDSLNSLDTWGKRWKWNKSKVRRFLKLLESDSMIVLKSERKTTRLSVCNYTTYQVERNANETQMKRKRNANETQTTPNKNDKNENNVKNEKKKSTPTQSLKELMTPFASEYDNETLNDFYRYWSEPNSRGKERWQLQRTWSTKGRLVTWGKNDIKFNSSGKTETVAKPTTTGTGVFAQ